jgi:HK97 family phage portal protein
MPLFERARAYLSAMISPTKPDGGGMGWSGGAPIFLSPTPPSRGALQLSVNPEGAFALDAYAAAIKVIAEDVAKLPIVVKESYRNPKTNATEHRRIETGAAVLLTRAPNPEMNPFEFKALMLRWKLGWGNAYAAIMRSASGAPVALQPVHPWRVEVERDPAGVLYYDVWNDGQGRVRVERGDMIHLKNYSLDGMVGLSMAQLAATTIATGLAQEMHADRFFSNGGRPGGVLEHPSKPSPDAMERLAKDWSDKFGGGNAYRTAVLAEGMKFHSIAMPNTDAQFLESRRFTVEQIARWFRISPSKLQDLSRATLTNIEEMGRSHLEDCLESHLVEFAEELSAKLLRAGRTATFDTSRMTRGKGVERAQFYNAGIMGGFLTVNDVREAENLNPFDSDMANAPLVQGAIVPLESIGQVEHTEPTEGASEAVTGAATVDKRVVGNGTLAARAQLLTTNGANGHG